ncbi:MAG TPA: cell envelope integrity protein CreD [Pseudomonadales bacterium]
MSDLVLKVLSGQTFRFAAVAVLVLVMLIPLAFVQGVSAERQRYFAQAAADIAASWGGPQTVSGPFLVVPDERDRVLLPSTLDVSVDVRHQMRTRGIYQVPVYQAVLKFSGTFVVPQSVGDRSVPARLVVGIGDTRAVAAVSNLELGGTEARFAAGTGEGWLGEGVHAEAALPKPGVSMPFAFELTLRGSQTLGVAPVGSETTIGMTSTWPHPSFTGRFLPDQHEIRADGFRARWAVHELARGLPPSRLQALATDYVSVSLFQPVTAYTRVDRGIKYGVLFIGLTFLTFVCFEIASAARFHYVQYAVVGAGLVLFYLALLSLSETLPFLWSYVIAALLLGSLVTWYVWRITRRLALSLGVFAILAALYLCLYVLLALEAYALLVGTGVLIVALFALMHVTSRLDEPSPAGRAYPTTVP